MLRFRLPLGRRSRRQRGLMLVVILLAGFLAGCASTRLAPAVAPNFEPERDEREIWDRADAFDQRMIEAGILSDDEALLTLIDTIAKRVLPHLGAGEDLPVRLHVVPNPYLNAWAQANGSIYLHSGIVARAENEAQLAVVVAHELSHYIRRHTLEEHRIAKNKHNRAMAGSILAAVLVGVVVDPGSYAAHLADVQESGHSRENEREADMDAFEAVRLAGYRVENAPRIFEQMKEEAREIEQPFYHGSHPDLARRIGYAKDYLTEHGLAPLAEGTPRGEFEETYDRNISALLLKSAELSFASGYRRKARRSIDRHLAADPDSLEGQLFRGRLALSRIADPVHREAAVRAYREVIRIDPDSAEGHRSLGLMLISPPPPSPSPSPTPTPTPTRSEGLRLLDRYLALEPDAVDRPIIEAYKSTRFGAEGAGL